MGGLIRGYKKHLTVPHPGWQRTDPLDRGLIGDWRFDPATGLVLPDYGGGGNHGVMVGDPSWVSTQYGIALELDGTNDYVDISASYASLTAFTVETFAYWDAGMGADGVLVRLGDAALQQAGGNVIRYWDSAAAHNTAFNPNNLWCHTVATSDGSVCNIFVNGNNELADDPIAVGQPPIMYIGRWGGAAEHQFKGQVCLARIYSRALTAAEVRARYELCLKRADPMTHVWMIPWGGVVGPPPVGQPMQLRGTTVPHLRQWHPRIA